MTHFTPPAPKVGMQRTWKSERWWHTQSSLGQLGPSVQKVTRTNVWALLFWSCLTGAEDQHSSASEGTPCYSELPLFLSTRESLGQGKVTLEGWEKAEVRLGPSNSWNQEQLLYGCPLAAACLCLLTPSSLCRPALSRLYFIRVHAWSFSLNHGRSASPSRLLCWGQ